MCGGDRVAEYEVKALFDVIYGNETLKKTLISDVEGKRLSHAFIIEGADGSGKKTLARTVLSALGKDSGRIREIMSGTCTDVFEYGIPEGKKQIGVELIREIRSSSIVRSGDLDFKAYIIENCEKMTVQAQNAFLKLLEEPTPDVYFFLLAENASALLPTVRSRAPVLRMEIFSVSDLGAYLKKHAPEAKNFAESDPEAFEMLLYRAGGSIGSALDELGNEKAGNTDLSKSVLDTLSMIKERRRGELLSLLEETCTEREKTMEYLKLLRLSMRDLIALRCDPDSELLFGEREALKILSPGFPVKKLLGVDMEIEKIGAELEINLNLSNVRIAVLHTLWHGFV